MRLVKFDSDKKCIDDFINITKKLYSAKTNMEDEGTIRQFLTDTHFLSRYITLDKFLVYRQDEVVGRFAITQYPEDKDACYIGFFECIDDAKVAEFIFENADSFAKEHGYKKIIGPVDASFWNKYRLKINLFDGLPYTGEPYNKDYYYKMFLDNGYGVKEHYVSNIFEKIDETYHNDKFTSHFDEFAQKGYEIISPKKKDFDKCIEEVYYLIMDLYSSFPMFKMLDKDDFISMFSSYKSIVNMDMVKMAYYKGKAVGFCISVPNYHNRVYHLTPLNILKILWTRKHPREYVMPYLGADRQHKGLGKAIAYCVAGELKKNNLPSISALIRDGNININYGEEKITDRYEYVLMEKELND